MTLNDVPDVQLVAELKKRGYEVIKWDDFDLECDEPFAEHFGAR